MAIAPKTIAAALAETVFETPVAAVASEEPKVATGEMSQEELDASGREEWPLHYAIAEALGGVVKPFDQYQGPYVLIGSEARGSGVYAPAIPTPGTVRLWISSDDGEMGTVYNEDNQKSSQPFDLYSPHAEDEAVAAAEEVLGGNEPAEVKHARLDHPLQSKTACMLKLEDGASDNAKLQRMVGDPLDEPTSAFAQFKPQPGTVQIPNPMSPIEGDEIFFTYMIAEAVFQSHDGQQWVILEYEWDGRVEIMNRFYPRMRANVSVYDIRRSIHSWVDPVQVVVPPPPPGITYQGQPVRIVSDQRGE